MIGKNIKIGFFLAVRQVKNANLWVNLLIISIMIITFLNLVFISGILDGLVEGASNELRNHYSGDIILTPAENRSHVTQSSSIFSELEERPETTNVSKRYLQTATLKTETERKTPNEEINSVNALLAGVDFERESSGFGLEEFIVEGSYPAGGSQEILLGSGLLARYDTGLADDNLENVQVGDKLKVDFGNKIKEFEVGGVLESKINQINERAYITDREFIKLTGRSRQNADEIATFTSAENLSSVQNEIENSIRPNQAKIEDWRENQGQFFDDLFSTFNLLGVVIGAIGIVVASITLFIVIFINAMSREKYIGIMKAVGVKPKIIRYSYIIQSCFYVLIGSTIGLLVLYTFLVPYFRENPIDFPFSDGILAVTSEGVAIRLAILIISAIAAGLIPAHMIVKKNTLDSLLGR